MKFFSKLTLFVLLCNSPLITFAQKSGILKYEIQSKFPKSIIYCTTNFNTEKTISYHDSLTNFIEGLGKSTFKIPQFQIYQYKDFKNKLILSEQNKVTILKDSLGNINWKITAEKKDIGKYNCRKATGMVYGRRYEVWYTPSIPIPSGPWKFYGLPGLILEANEINGNIKFAFVSLKISQKQSISISQPVLIKNQKLVNKVEYIKILGIKKKKDEKPIIVSNKDGETIVKSKTGNGLEIWE